MTLLFFPFKWRHVVRHCHSSWIYRKLPNFVKISPKTISLKNFEIPPKVEILYFSPNTKNLVYGSCTKAYTHLLNFQYNYFLNAFLLSKNGLCMWILAYPLVKIIFSQHSTPLVGMRYYKHIPNLPIDNKMLRNPCLLDKVIFLAFKTLLSPLAQKINKKLSTLNAMMWQIVRNGFDRHIDIEVSYKSLCLEILNEALILLNSPYFE